MNRPRLERSVRSMAPALVCLALALPVTAAAQIFGSDPEGLKRTDKLIEGAQNLIKEATIARQDIDKTLTSYNALFKEDVTDVRKAYKDVEKNIERTEAGNGQEEPGRDEARSRLLFRELDRKLAADR